MSAEVEQNGKPTLNGIFFTFCNYVHTWKKATTVLEMSSNYFWISFMSEEEKLELKNLFVAKKRFVLFWCEFRGFANFCFCRFIFAGSIFSKWFSRGCLQFQTETFRCTYVLLNGSLKKSAKKRARECIAKCVCVCVIKGEREREEEREWEMH